MITADDVLAHFGVKGMRWGQRKDRSSRVTVETGPGGRIKTTGGYDRKPSSDAVSAARLKQKVRKSSVRSLSNDELAKLIKRESLEKQYVSLQGENAFRRGVKVTKEILGIGELGRQVYGVARDAVSAVKK